MGNTWGISGPVFLALYGAGLLATWLLLRRERERLARPVLTLSDPDQLGTYEVALLRGGDDLAVTTAVASLSVSSAIDAGDRHLRGIVEAEAMRAKGTSPSPLRALVPVAAASHPLETEVYEVVRRSAPLPDQVRELVGKMPVLGAVRGRLVEAGLLYSDAARKQISRHAFFYVGLLAVGVARLVAALSRGGKPVGFLVMLLIPLTFALIVDSIAVRHNSLYSTARAGRLLRELRRRQKSLKKDAAAGRLAPAAFPMAMALFGAGVLWKADPWLASALGVRTNAAGSGGFAGGCGGGGCGGGGGGCGG